VSLSEQAILQPAFEVLLFDCASDLDEEMQDRLRRPLALLFRQPLGPEDLAGLRVHVE
jgi:hypothetical protein